MDVCGQFYNPAPLTPVEITHNCN